MEGGGDRSGRPEKKGGLAGLTSPRIDRGWGFGVMLVLWRRARDGEGEGEEEDGGERVRIKAAVFARLRLCPLSLGRVASFSLSL